MGKNIFNLIVILFLYFIVCSTLYTQTITAINYDQPQIDVELWVRYASTDSQELHFGFDQFATHCLDPIFFEVEAPPPPPPGIFDVRLSDPRGFDAFCMGGGAFRDFRYLDTAMTDTFEIDMVPASTSKSPYVLSWPAELSLLMQSCQLKDINDNLIADMLATQAASIPYSSRLVSIFIYALPKSSLSAIPELVSPANGSTGQLLIPTLVWTRVPGASTYCLQVSTDSNFTSTVVADSTLIGTSKQVGPLMANTTYFWRVRGKHGSSTSGWSQVWNFTTQQSPSITVVPDSFFVSFAEGDSTTRTMTIGNTGLGELKFKITNSSIAASSAISYPHLIRSSILSNNEYLGTAKMQSNNGNSQSLIRHSHDVHAASGDTLIRIVTIDLGKPENYQVLDLLGFHYTKLSPADFNSVDLSQYDVLYVGWTYNANPAGMLSLYNRRNDIQSFVEGGGGLIALANPSGTPYAWQWVPANLNPVDMTGNNVHVTQPLHPVMDSLTDSLLSYWSISFHNVFSGYDSFLQSLAVGVEAGNQAVTLAGTLGAGRMVLTGQDPDYHYVVNGNSSAAILIQNMIRWTSHGGIRWLSEFPDSGTVSPGTTKDITVKFNTANLEGGDYHATIIITNNDPAHNPKTVQVHLHVIGKPIISINPDSIDFGIAYVGYGKTDTMIVKNTGSDVLIVSNISSDNPVFSVNKTSFTVPAHGKQSVVVTFTPTDLVSYTGTLTVSSNDSSHLDKNVWVRGHGVHPPSITVSPDSFTVSINEGDSTTRTMTIGNVGRGELNWNIDFSQESKSRFAQFGADIRQVFHQVAYLPSTNRAVPDNSKFDLSGALVGTIDQAQFPPDKITKSIIHGDTVRVAVVRSLGTTYIPTTWDYLNNNFAYFGSRPIHIDYSTLNISPITFSALVNSHADVLVISDAWNPAQPYGSLSLYEINAITQYVEGGHGLIITSGTFNTSLQPAHNHLAPLLGLDSSVFYKWNNGIYYTGNDISNFLPFHHPVFDSIPYPYVPYSHSSVAIYGGWSKALNVGERIADTTPSDSGIIVAYHNRLYCSTTPEIYPSNNDYRFLYNAMVWAGSVVSWLSGAPSSGVVVPGANQDVTIKFNASNLSGGDYRSNIVVNNNDPLNNPKTVPVHLHVIGKPVISIAPDSIDFGTVYIGYNKTDTMIVKNTGSDVLAVSNITSDNPVFSVNKTSFTVPAHGEQSVVVTFTPTDSVSYTGTLMVSSNDSSHLEKNVFVSGRGAYPPSITVSPDSFTVSIGERDSTTRTMTIGNTGLGELHWNTKGQAVGSVASARITYIPAEKVTEGSTQHQAINKASHGNGQIQGKANQPITFMSSASTLVLYDTQISSSLLRALRESGVDFDSVYTTDFTTINFAPYSRIVIAMDGGYLTPGSLAAVANEVNSGKSLMMFGGSARSDFITQVNANLVQVNTSNYFWTTSSPPHLQVVNPGNFLAQGLPTTVTYMNTNASYYMLRLTDAGAIVVAKNGDNQPVLFEKTHGSGRLMYFTPSLYESYWYTDYSILITIVRNMIRYSGGGFVSVTPDSGMVSPGSSQDVAVKFNSKNLEGGDYRANIVITNNDPPHNPKIVPVHLHVIGKPVISINPDSIDFGIAYVGYGKTDTMIVKNTGSDVLIVSNILPDNPVFSVNKTSFTVPAHGEQSVVVTFTPTDSVSYTGTLMVSSNDSSHLEKNVFVRGHGTYPPSISVSPDSFTVSLGEGDSTTRTMTIGNTGLGPLYWTVTGTSITKNKVFSDHIQPQNEYEGNVFNGVEVSDPTALQNFFIARNDPKFQNGAHQNRKWEKLLTNMPATTTINFDDTTAPCLFANTYALHLRYAELGVTFQSGTNISGGAIVDSCGNWGVSGFSRPNFLGFNTSATLANGGRPILPETLYFSSPVGSVSANFGHGYHNSPVTITVTGFNSFNSVVARDSISPASDLQPLEISGPGITKVVISASSFYSYSFVIDDLSFGGSPWLSVDPTSGTIAPSVTQGVTVKFDAKDLSGGDYQSNIVINNNDPAHNPKTIPVLLHVIGKPAISITPDSIDFGTVYIGYNKTDTMIVKNTGSDVLAVSNITSDNPVFSVNKTSFTVPAHGEQSVVVTFTPTDSVSYTGTLTISSNDSSHLEKTVFVRGLGVSRSPQIVSIKDVPHDQGGCVTLKWNASSLDTNVNMLPLYSIWRALPEGMQPAGMELKLNEMKVDLKDHCYRYIEMNNTNYAWEWIGNQPAHRFTSYSFTAPTLFDSMSTTNGKHYFLVSAHTNDPNIFYDSNIDSGHSVDNLSPSPPKNAAGCIVGNAAILHWNRNTETDLSHYEIYRCLKPNFDPDSMSALTTTTDTAFSDPMMPPFVNYHYALRAVDIHGNLSAKSNEVTTGRGLDVEEKSGLPTEFVLDQNYPNPFNPSTVLRYGIPSRSSVKLEIINTLGQNVATLVNSEQEAGYYAVEWQANVGSGIYFCRILAVNATDPTQSFTQVRKMLLLR